MKDLVTRGFGGVKAKVESKPPKHFRTALGQIVNFFTRCKVKQPERKHFQTSILFLRLFIRYDQLTYRDIKQAMQEFVFNMNVPTRVGFQTPFTNITMDLTVSLNACERSCCYRRGVAKRAVQRFWQ